jgi:hypothetical protein
MAPRIFIGFFAIILLTFCSCNEETPDAIIPFAYVNEDINLNNIQYLNLKNTGGFVYFNAGYKGLIIYNEGNGDYRVFERACTFDPKSDCAPVTVDPSGLFMKHECCKSTFDFDGNPTGGPANARLLQYYSVVDGIYLKIRNE